MYKLLSAFDPEIKVSEDSKQTQCHADAGDESVFLKHLKASNSNLLFYIVLWLASMMICRSHRRARQLKALSAMWRKTWTLEVDHVDLDQNMLEVPKFSN